MSGKTVTDYLSDYAAYHRDRRNVAIHGVGIPLIVLALVILASRPAIHAGAFALSPAAVLLAALVVFYLVLDRTLGLVFAGAAVVMTIAGGAVAAQPTPVWLGAGAGAFAFGWVLQFIGHGLEGKKPAFFDDVMGLAIGPLFVTAEALFAAGAKPQLKAAIEARVGPAIIRGSTAEG